MVLGLFIWVVVVILSGAFVFSYLVWSPPWKSPTVIAVELVEITNRLYFAVMAFTIFLCSLSIMLWLFKLFE